MCLNSLYEIATTKKIDIYEMDFVGTTKGLYADNTIGIKRSMTTIEKRCTLGEEIGHHDETVGDITDLTKVENRKQERRARGKGYLYTISPDDIVDALLHPCASENELLDYLKVTPNHFIDAINYYKEKYGLYYRCKDYTLYFEPLYVLGASYEGRY